MAIALPPVFDLIELDSIDSTNSEAQRRAEAGAGDGTLILARRQTAGRGRRGRRWSSPYGNLYCSLVLRPDCDAAKAAQLSFLSALAAGEAIAGMLPPLAVLTYKWPNDVLVEGAKLAGILLESTSRSGAKVDWVVVGVGVNVASAPSDTPYPATSLVAEGAEDASIETVLGSFARHFLRWRDLWFERGFAPLRAAWLARAQGLGGPVEVQFENRRLSGRFADLDADGALLLEDTAGGGLRRIAAGDVHPVQP